MLEQVTHTRYEEKKETEVGDGDRELSRLPGPAGSTGTKSDSPPTHKDFRVCDAV